MIIKIFFNLALELEIKYVLNQFFRCLNYSFEIIKDKNKADIVISNTFEKNLNNNQLHFLISIDLENIIKNKNSLDLNKINNLIINKIKTPVFNQDILLSSFIFMARYEEFISKSKQDKYGRFCFKNSLYNKLNFFDIPIVDQYFKYFVDVLKHKYKNIKIINIWDNKDFFVLLTHDIDIINVSTFINVIFSFLGDILKRKRGVLSSIKLLYFNLKKYFLGKHKYLNFNWIMNLEKKFKIRSDYYFLDKINSDYSFKSLRFMFNKLIKHKFNIGLHSSIQASNSKKYLLMEKEKLIKYAHSKIEGGRNHYLTFDIHQSFDVISQSNNIFDSSLAFAEKCGYRNGFSYPYQPFNFKTRQNYEFWEFPLVIMDGSLDFYQKLNPDQAYAEILSKLDYAKANHSLITILWHNSFFIQNPSFTIVYEKILAYINQQNGVGGTSSQLLQFLSKNKSII